MILCLTVLSTQLVDSPAGGATGARDHQQAKQSPRALLQLCERKLLFLQPHVFPLQQLLLVVAIAHNRSAAAACILLRIRRLFAAILTILLVLRLRLLLFFLFLRQLHLLFLSVLPLILFVHSLECLSLLNINSLSYTPSASRVRTSNCRRAPDPRLSRQHQPMPCRHNDLWPVITESVRPEVCAYFLAVGVEAHHRPKSPTRPTLSSSCRRIRSRDIREASAEQFSVA
jgi:hypothetical protein